MHMKVPLGTPAECLPTTPRDGGSGGREARVSSLVSYYGVHSWKGRVKEFVVNGNQRGKKF